MSPNNPTKGELQSAEDTSAIPTAIESLVDQEYLDLEALEGAIPIPRPFPTIPKIPITPAVSGLYQWSHPVVIPRPIPGRIPIKPIPGPFPVRPGPQPQPEGIPGLDGALGVFPILSEELRLDVDGRYPQKVSSGVARINIASRVHWIANLTKTGPSTYQGKIWYKDGAVASFPYTDVKIDVVASFFPNQKSATATFTGGGAPQRVRVFKFTSPYFHPVNFEFDCAQGESALLSINTCAHPNRPATLPCETLTIETVYRRTGFDVTTSPGGPVPLSGAGVDAKWSDQEMHDAMQTYWSKFANTAQWAMWVFFASLHEQGTSLGGVMFDDIGPNHRQGTSIFNDSFISQAPSGDPNPAAWVQRMIFWTACHEMGHAFNLAHSWQKSLVFGGKGPWIPLANEPEARSFMNYPYNVSGGQSAFFSNFEFRFTDPEMLFLRHAPARFVQQGNAEWFDHHGFEEANVSPEPALALALRVNRDTPQFEFLEPVSVELKLTNVSSQPQIADRGVLSLDGKLILIVKRKGQPARQVVPFARYCRLPEQTVIMPGESIYDCVEVSAGLGGFNVDEPGIYTLQAALEIDGEDVVSEPLQIRVLPPRGYDDEYMAQEFFSDEVARVIIFRGSEFLDSANQTLLEITDRLKDRRVALHANLALGTPLALKFKQLKTDDQRPVGIEVRKPKIDEAQARLSAALLEQPEAAVESFGHIGYRNEIDLTSDRLAKEGSQSEAARAQDILFETMSARQVGGRKVLGRVLEEIKQTRDSYKGAAKKK